jgi:hypothetical protein
MTACKHKEAASATASLRPARAVRFQFLFRLPMVRKGSNFPVLPVLQAGLHKLGKP